MLNFLKNIFKPKPLSEETIFKHRVYDSYMDLVKDFPFKELKIRVDNWVNPPRGMMGSSQVTKNKVNCYRSYIIRKGIFGSVYIIVPLPNCNERYFFEGDDSLDEYIRKDKMFSDFTDAYISAVNKRLTEIRR